MPRRRGRVYTGMASLPCVCACGRASGPSVPPCKNSGDRNMASRRCASGCGNSGGLAVPPGRDSEDKRKVSRPCGSAGVC